MSKTDHPFQPGVRVAVDETSRFNSGPRQYREDFVEKVYKNGNFTLKSAPGQQWHAWSNSTSATRTGDSTTYLRRSLKLWTPEIDEQVKEGIAYAARLKRWRAIEDATRNNAVLVRLTDEALTHFEAGIAALKEKP